MGKTFGTFSVFGGVCLRISFNSGRGGCKVRRRGVGIGVGCNLGRIFEILLIR